MDTKNVLSSDHEDEQPTENVESESVWSLKDLDSSTESDPFLAFKIDSLNVLSTLQGRSKCPLCQASRKWFCYSCFVPVDRLKGKIPRVKLPIKVTIVKHPKEIEGKSTAVHAALLAPDDATVAVYPDIPTFTDPSKVVLVFPSKDAVSLEDIVRQQSAAGRSPTEAIGSDSAVNSSHQADSNFHPELPTKRRKGDSGDTVIETKRRDPPFHHVIFIDSTWSQTNKITNDLRLQGQRTLFNTC